MSGFDAEQLRQLDTVVRKAVREEMGDAGLRLESPAEQDEARRDFMWVRATRLGINGIAGKVGWLVIAAVLGAVFFIVQLGLNEWRKNGGP